MSYVMHRVCNIDSGSVVEAWGRFCEMEQGQCAYLTKTNFHRVYISWCHLFREALRIEGDESLRCDRCRDLDKDTQ